MAKYIDADALRAKMYHDAFEEDSEEQKWDDGCWIRYKMFERNIDSMPAADIPRWIPVTERLPEERGTYLVTVNDGGIRVAIAQWWYDVDDGEGYFVCDDCYAEDIVAWMPLPESYRGEKNGE